VFAHQHRFGGAFSWEEIDMDNKKTVRPRGTDSAKVIEVIETKSIRGDGTADDVCREVIQYWSLDGELLAERE